MRNQWLVYKLYPGGKKMPSTHEELNGVRVKLEAQLKKLARPYRWFTLLVRTESVKFGVKTKEEGASLQVQLESALKPDYPDVSIGLDGEDPDDCEIMAIATQCRTKLEERLPVGQWTPGLVGFLMHAILNPYGFDNAAWSYWTSLCCIDEDSVITNSDIRDVITLVRFFLEYKRGMELEDDYDKLDHTLKELEGLVKYLKTKSS
jgi:hypothetical protein